MNAKNKNSKSKKLPITLIVIGLVLAAGVVSGFVFQDKIKTAFADVQTSIENSSKPAFTFDSAKFPDWATTGNTWSDNTADDAPITTLSIAQCTPGSHCGELVEKCRPNKGKGSDCEKLEHDTVNGCDIHLYYMRHSIDPSKALADKVKQQTSFNDGTTMQEIAVKTLTMNTPEGAKQYQLHEYDVDRKGDARYKHGNAYGYLSLDDGHIEIQSVCSEASQLDETLPALNAVSFVK